MILVTGAAGKTGRAVVRALVARGESVRAFVHRAEQAEQMRALGARDVIAGDVREEALFDQAVRGVRAIYHICPNVHPDEITIGKAVIAAARRAGVGHFVYHSVLHPQTEAMPHHWNKLRVEEALFESGLPFTILQPAPYMQNILTGWQVLLNRGVYAVPYSVQARLSMVDLEDVAQAASVVLTQPGHIGATYELAGPEVLTQSEVAEILSRAIGRPVRAERMSLEAWSERARAVGLGEYALSTLVRMFDYYDRFGLWGNPEALGTLLGRMPTRFEAFLQRMAQEGMSALPKP